MSKLNLPRISDLLKLYQIKPLKKYSQNFLLGSSAELFIKSIDPNALCVEIGTGPGSITRSLLRKGAKNIIGIEQDERFRPILEQLRDASQNRFDFIIGDALQDNELQLTSQIIKSMNPSKIVIFGNLPFQIGGKLLSMWNYQCLARIGYFAIPDVEMYLMFTRDVAERLLPNTRKGQFSAITNIAFQVELDHHFDSTCFTPRPSQDCISLKFTKRQKQFFLNESELKHFYEFMRIVYHQPNKTISRLLKDQPQLITEFQIEPNQKIHQVNLITLIEMSKRFVI
jgi:16S rRNA A1518/A1519 N6-dimethyltransferase RsmA/KsgA/DIM1 with predicted DNA glycosylase/AP lyase activity